MEEWPKEICCSICGEVLILAWQPIPGPTPLKELLDWLDTPMVPTDPLHYCPLCGYGSGLTWLAKLSAAGV